ncbi:hypothetical protein KKF25_03415 [Patescibacteria group bacterium]|nr:hypothetical protein [Patescibacteria group bacterium]
MRKKIAITVLALFLMAATAWAATTDFVADGNITVSAVTFGNTTANMLIMSGSKAASWTFNSGAFTVTDPDATAGFKVGSANTSVKTFKVTKSDGSGSVCAENGAAGTSYVTLSTTADTYTITPSAYSVCTDHCSSVTGAATYNAYPTCGAATCNTGYRLSGSGASGVCLVTGGGGVSGGGGGYTTLGLATPSPSPSPTASVSPSPTPTPGASPVPSTETPQTPRPAAPASGSTAGLGVVGIKEGELIRPANDFRVYIVKGGFARWIQNPKIFSIYKHFKPSDVKVIAANDLTKYTEASLIRAAGDPKVYEINGDGTRHWINMTAAAFSKSGRNWNMVYVVNPAEVKLYQAGADVMK